MPWPYCYAIGSVVKTQDPSFCDTTTQVQFSIIKVTKRYKAKRVSN
jgi:hypothetical protein